MGGREDGAGGGEEGSSDSQAPQIITRPAEVCDQSSKSLHMCVWLYVLLFSGFSVSCVPAASHTSAR